MIRCPAYDDLIWFADTGLREALGGHDPERCARCRSRLEDYAFMKKALGGLRGIYEPEGEASAAGLLPVIPSEVEAVKHHVEDAKSRFHLDWPEARRRAEAAEAQARVLHYDDRLQRHAAELVKADAENTLGVCLFRTGDPAGAFTFLHRSLGRWRQLSEPVGTGSTLINLALLANYQGRQIEAEASASEACKLLDAVGQAPDAAKARVILGIVLHNRGKHAAALAHFQRAADCFRRCRMDHDLAICLQNEGMVHFALKRRAEAAAAARAGEALFRKLGHQTEAARCLWLCGRAQVAGGEREAGMAALGRARSSFASGGLWIEAALIGCDEAKAEMAENPEGARRRLAAVCREIPSDLQNAWVAEAVETLQRALARPEEEPLGAALAALASRLNDGPPPLEPDPGLPLN